MKHRMLATAISLLATAAITAACSSSTPKRSERSTPSATTSSPTSTATSPAPTTAAASSTDPATAETANRRDIEAAWTKFWGVYVKLHSIPTSEVTAAVNSVAVGVTKTQMLNEIKVFQTGHKTSYGYVVNHPYWNQSVGGKTRATMGDCMDQSHYGSASTVTHRKLTVGVARDNTKATFAKGTDGAWRVHLIEYLLDVKC
jgi:hypothetical protein